MELKYNDKVLAERRKNMKGRLSVASGLYDKSQKGYLNSNEQMLRDLDTDGDGVLTPAELAPFLDRHDKLRKDNARLRKRQLILGATTVFFGILSIVTTVLAIRFSKEIVVSKDGLLASKTTGTTVVTQSKGVSIVSELQNEVDGFSGVENSNECVSMEDVASLYKAFGEGTDVRILTNDSSVSGLNDGHITFPVTKVQGSTASINETHVIIGDAAFDIAADNPCNRGGRTYPHGPRKLFHDHLHGRHRKLEEIPISATPVSAFPSSSDTIYDAVIIGAGWAGISAAATLMSEGVEKILILEGRDYIGGRSRTVTDFVPTDPTVPFELGSEFIYTSYANDIVDVFRKENVSSKEATRDFVLYDPNISNAGEGQGSRVDNTMYSELSSELWKDGFLRYVQKQYLVSSDNYKSLLKDFENENDITDPDEQQFLLAETNHHVVIEYGEDAMNVNAKDTHDWLSEVDYASIDLTSVPGGGYSRAIDGVVDDNGIAEKVFLGAKVQKVNYENDFVKIDYIQDERINKSVWAQTVLVTVPLGVLQSGDMEFSPPLPATTQDAIESMQVGILDKLIMYWNDDTMGRAPIFQENWDAISDKTWLELVTPETETSEVWTALLNTRRFNGQNTLTAWIAGSAAEEMEAMDDQAIIDVALANLRTMFGSDVPPPTKFIVTRWGADEFSKGSYSYRSVDVDYDDYAGKLSSSVEDKVFFAGEHTSDSGWHSTTVGAFETGRQAAKSMKSKIANEILVSYSKFS